MTLTLNYLSNSSSGWRLIIDFEDGYRFGLWYKVKPTKSQLRKAKKFARDQWLHY